MKYLLTLLAIVFLSTFTNAQTPSYSEAEQPDTVVKAPYTPPLCDKKTLRQYKSAMNFQKQESNMIQIAAKMTQMRSFTTVQIVDFIDYVPEKYRVDFALLAYKYCPDKENYTNVVNYFKKQKDKDTVSKNLAEFGK
jgi:hypothetical protein